MYCDFQIYTPMMVPNMVPTPSMISSNQLFKVISIALQRNLNQYLHNRKVDKANSLQKVQQAHTQTKKCETIVIDLQSESQLNSQNVVNQKNILVNNLKFSPVQETVLETGQKDQILQAQQIEIISQTINGIQKEINSKEKLGFQENFVQIKYQKKLPPTQNFISFTVQVPRLGISNSQLLKKKQKLLRRKVADWEEVENKGPRQRRQLRMLKN